MKLQPFLFAGFLSFSVACGSSSSSGGSVKLDGSSTVFLISEAVSEDFQKENPNIKVSVGISGTGGGFKKFCAGEVDIADASRPIKATEIEICKKANIEYIEVPIAYDGITILVNPKNDWASDITTDELKKMWEKDAQAKMMKWSDIRPGWPEKELRLFGAGVDSGTYDYFTEAINHKEHESRGDYTASEDDNVIVQGISKDEMALGFLGFAYYEENQDKLKVLPVNDGKDDNGAGAITPSPETIRNTTYQPLSRPLFIYVSKSALERKEVSQFIDFYLKNASKLAPEVGYIALTEKTYGLVQKRITEKKTGSLFGGKGSKVGVSLDELLEKGGI